MKTITEKFMSFVKKTSSCWLWTGAKDQKGYGFFKFGGVNYRTHRFSFEHFKGEIKPEKPQVLHRCDNPSCVNPAHLWAGTTQENTADRVNKGRSAKGERNGASKLTAEQVGKIRAMLRAGKSQRPIAKMFSVSQQTIQQINSKKIWN